MGTFTLAVGTATVAWFVAAAILFFNKPIDTLYRGQEKHPAVRTLPNSPQTIVKILAAVFVQCVLWAGVFALVADALPGGLVGKALSFGGIVVAVKVVPRDVDRLLLTTYPLRRMAIEFVIGSICAFVVGFAFAWAF